MRRMWGPIALVLLAGLASLPGHADEAGELTRYDIRVALDPTTQTLVGSQRIDYFNDTGETLDEVVLSLIGNWRAEPNPYLHPALLDPQYVSGFDPTWTRIGRVTDGSDRPLIHRLEPLAPIIQTYSLGDGLLIVELPAPLAPGERFALHVEFETRFAHALIPENCVYRDTYVWRFGWHPIAVSPTAADSQFVLPAAHYRVELTVPEGYRAFGGADRQVERETVGGLTTYELENDRPARSVPLVIGSRIRVVSSTWNDVDLEAVYQPGGETSARLALSHAAEILSSYSEQYGPFGYRRLVIVESPAPGLFGMAADGMILVGRSAAQLRDMPALGVYDRLVEYLLAHEAAHLWWGIGIGTDFDAENWISEGFAEYLSIGYFEDKYGAFEPNLLSHLGPGLMEDVILTQFGYLNLRQHLSEAPYIDLLRLDFDEALVKPSIAVDYLNGQTVRVYNKGYLVLRALDTLLGREIVRTALVEANARWRGRVFSTEAFQNVAEDVSGIDLSAFFADWVYGDTRVDIAVEGFDAIESDGGFATTVRLWHKGGVLPVTVRATVADGSFVEKRWAPDGASNTLVFETGAPIVSVHVDPNEMIPDANRFNNHSPRRVLVKHPFRSKDAPQIGRPLDAYVISISPIGISGGFRNDHMWNLAVIPHVDVDAASIDFANIFESWDIVGLLAADASRRLSFSAAATVTALDLSDGSGEFDAQFTVHTRGFTYPETGPTGTYWYPSNQFDLSFGARGDLPSPVPFVGLTFRRSDSLTLYMENTLTLEAGIPGFATAPFATLEWVGAKRFRLAPLFYFDVSASVGTSLLGEPPTEFMFSMGRLHAFALPPYGYNQLFGRAAIVLPPIARNQGYAILNLTRLEGVTAVAFVQGGRTWGGCDRVCESGIRIETGAILAFRLDGFLGTSIEFSVGYAHPLFGLDGEGAAFVEFGGMF